MGWAVGWDYRLRRDIGYGVPAVCDDPSCDREIHRGGQRIPFYGFPARWGDLSHPDALIRTKPNGGRYDAKAGPRRNQRMIDEGRPTLGVGFPGGRGSADMARRLRAAGIETIIIEAPPAVSVDRTRRTRACGGPVG